MSNQKSKKNRKLQEFFAQDSRDEYDEMWKTIFIKICYYNDPLSQDVL